MRRSWKLYYFVLDTVSTKKGFNLEFEIMFTQMVQMAAELWCKKNEKIIFSITAFSFFSKMSNFRFWNKHAPLGNSI